MYKSDRSENTGKSSKQLSNKSRLKQSKQTNSQDNRSKQFKENDSKHLNAIKPYVTKQRKNSKRQIATSDISRSKSRKLDSSNRKAQLTSMITCQNTSTMNPTQGNKQTNQISQELALLRTQYKSLKASYNCLMKEREQVGSKQQTQKQNRKKQKQTLVEQLQRSNKSSTFLTSQIQRIKKECFKILQSQKFKYKKLEQTLQQKQLMISYLRKQIQYLKRSKDLNVSQQQNLQKIFFLKYSAPIFSYESYARLSANTSAISGIGNVLIQERSTQRQLGQRKLHKCKNNQLQEDSLSLSRDKSKQFDSVHSLLSSNKDKNILTFTKKDIIVLNDSMSFDDNKLYLSSSENQDRVVLQNRKNEDKQILNFENPKSKKTLYKSESRVESKNVKTRSQHAKRLEILTGEFMDMKAQKSEGQNSCETKKKFSKSKTRNVIKNSKCQGLHISMINQVLHGSFIKTDTQTKNTNSKRK